VSEWGGPRSLLLVDDDPVFCDVLRRALERRGLDVRVANDVPQAEAAAKSRPPRYVVLDLRMPGPSGLTLIDRLQQIRKDVRIVVLTGYASVATAVEAIKLGAVHYLTKPADADQILEALHRDEGDAEAAVSEQPLSVSRLQWEHIQKVLVECEGNVSETARRLGMHRRTLQRKLAKRPVRR
jgi:two-component system response regulator RegA